jgi:hypothetical protein
MLHAVNIDLAFPIKDEESAWLMRLKAELLCESGIIDRNEKGTILERAAAVLQNKQPKPGLRAMNRRKNAHIAR